MAGKRERRVPAPGEAGTERLMLRLRALLVSLLPEAESMLANCGVYKYAGVMLLFAFHNECMRISAVQLVHTQHYAKV